MANARRMSEMAPKVSDFQAAGPEIQTAKGKSGGFMGLFSKKKVDKNKVAVMVIKQEDEPSNG